MGPALQTRGEEKDKTSAVLSSHLQGVCDMLPRVYGGSAAQAQASIELGQIVRLGDDTAEIACKRAALLYALHQEPELRRHFTQQESAAFAEDMVQRVLPFVVPRFVKHSCQTPESFVTVCVMLSEMWRGEQLGNWPRTTTDPLGS